MKTLKKTKIVTALIGALSILSFTIIFTGGSIAHANPDYICFKVTYDSPCNITSYSAWDRATKSRIATGYQVTSVYYYSVRIGCEGGDSGYVVGSAG
jgi:hypothetical protein